MAKVFSAKPSEMDFSEDGYATHMLSNILELRRNGEFCDVVLKVGNSELCAHKVVLAASSSYFSAMFRGNMSEKHQEKIDIKGVNCESFETLLDYAYTGQFTVTKTNVEDLLHAADLFGFTPAKQGCEKFLEAQLDPTNCLGILQCGERYSCETLCKAAKLFMNNKFKAVANNDEILKLDVKQLNSFLESDDLNIDDEYVLLELIIKWVSHDPENNRKWLSSLLPAVKLPFVDPRRLKELSKHHLVEGDIFVQDIIEEAMTCHSECAGIAMRPSCASWLYVLGGEKSFMKETRSIEYFDCKETEWVLNTTKMSGCRVSSAVLVLKNVLYVIGGCKRGEKLSAVQCYNPQLNCWQNVAHLNKCKGDVKAAALNGMIFVAGGSCSGQPTCSHMEKYCPNENKWSTVSSMAHKRRRFVLVSLQGLLYAIGGFDDVKGFLSSVESYSPSSNQWSKVASMHHNRGDFGAVELSGYIYAIGGVNEQQGSMCSVERYNPAKNVWIMMSPMKSCRGGLATAVYCGKIFALNGMNEYMSVVDSVECYDETKNTWNSVASTRTARFGASAVVCPYLISKVNN